MKLGDIAAALLNLDCRGVGIGRDEAALIVVSLRGCSNAGSLSCVPNGCMRSTAVSRWSVGICQSLR